MRLGVLISESLEILEGEGCFRNRLLSSSNRSLLSGFRTHECTDIFTKLGTSIVLITESDMLKHFDT